MRSLSARLTLVAAGVLAAFFGLAGAALDRAYRESVDAAVREQLRAQIYVLLGAAEIGDEPGIAIEEAFIDARYGSPASGLIAAVVDERGAIWKSVSSAGHEVGYPGASVPGEFVFELVRGGDGEAYHAVSYPVTWELGDGVERGLVFQVARSLGDARGQVTAFRRTLWAWLGAAGLFLVLAQAGVLRWGLAPLRRVAREVEAIERGESTRLGGRQPRELEPLTANLNALLASGAVRLRRYRHALDDLAHSLKTPLAVLRGLADRHAIAPDHEAIAEQVERMEQAIAYHVQRGAAAGRTALTGTVDPGATARRLGASLAKVYADKGVVLEIEAGQGVPFAGDAGDLTEIFGNLMDNAYKWCRARVRVTVGPTPDGGLAIEIEDDGPGIAAADRRAVLERGVRADELVPGQGIGLALVREMVEEAYGGSIELGASGLGGARVRVVL